MAPEDKGWNRITVRRMLCSAYIGDTAKSAKSEFKSKDQAPSRADGSSRRAPVKR